MRPFESNDFCEIVSQPSLNFKIREQIEGSLQTLGGFSPLGHMPIKFLEEPSGTLRYASSQELPTDFSLAKVSRGVCETLFMN